MLFYFSELITSPAKLKLEIMAAPVAAAQADSTPAAGPTESDEELVRLEHLLQQQVNQCEALSQKSSQGKGYRY